MFPVEEKMDFVNLFKEKRMLQDFRDSSHWGKKSDLSYIFGLLFMWHTYFLSASSFLLAFWKLSRCLGFFSGVLWHPESP